MNKSFIILLLWAVTSSVFLNNLFAQSSNYLESTEWITVGNGKWSSGYMFKFKDGQIKTDWGNEWGAYFTKNENIFICDNSHFKTDTAFFEVVKLNADSLVINPSNIQAGELAYYINRKTHAMRDDSFQTAGAIKFYNRKLSFKEIGFDSLILISPNFKIKIKFTGDFEKVTLKNLVPEKKFRGQMKEDRIHQLREMLNRSNIYNVNRKGDAYIHGSTLTLFLYQKGEFIELKFDENHTQWTLKPLVDFMLSHK